MSRSGTGIAAGAFREGGKVVCRAVCLRFPVGVPVGFRPFREGERRDSRTGAFPGLPCPEQEQFQVDGRGVGISLLLTLDLANPKMV